MKNLSLVLVALFFGLQLSAKDSKHWMQKEVSCYPKNPQNSGSKVMASPNIYFKRRPGMISQDYNSLFECEKGNTKKISVGDQICTLDCRGKFSSDLLSKHDCLSQNNQKPVNNCYYADSSAVCKDKTKNGATRNFHRNDKICVEVQYEAVPAVENHDVPSGTAP